MNIKMKRGSGDFYHRICEPVDKPYWYLGGLSSADLIQYEPKGPWRVRYFNFSKSASPDFSEPVSFREALTRATLGIGP